MGFGIGTMGQDDGYQGADAVSPVALTAEQEEIAALTYQIVDLDDAAQNAEDREQIGRASALRAKIRPLQARIDALVAAQRTVRS